MRPCPFCGSSAIVRGYRKMFEYWAAVYCRNAECKATGPVIARSVRRGQPDGERGVRIDAVAAWDGRTP